MTISKITRNMDDYLVELSLNDKCDGCKVKLKAINTKTGSYFKATIANRNKVTGLNIDALMRNAFYGEVIPENVITEFNEMFELLKAPGTLSVNDVTYIVGLDTICDKDDEYFAIVCDLSSDKVVATIYYTADLEISKIVGDIDDSLLKTIKHHIAERIKNEFVVE